jgi:hypothetical protein
MDPSSDWVVNGGKYALDFDGSNDHVITTAPGPVTAQRAISVWFNCSTTFALSSYGGLVSYGGSVGTIGSMFLVTFGSDGNFGSSGFGVSQYGDGVAASGFNDGKWHHGLIVNSASFYEVYVDGILRASKTMTTNPAASSVYLGRWSPNPFSLAYYSGLLDDCIIFDAALTASEVREIYRRGRGYGIGASPHRSRRATAAGFKAYWARRQSQLIGGGV